MLGPRPGRVRAPGLRPPAPSAPPAPRPAPAGSAFRECLALTFFFFSFPFPRPEQAMLGDVVVWGREGTCWGAGPMAPLQLQMS